MNDGAIPLTEVFQKAEHCLEAKRFGEAERLYRQVLGSDDRHAGSWHGLGVIALHCGRPDTAVGFIGKALVLKNDMAPYHASLGTAFEGLGRLEEAISSFRQALLLNPDDLDTQSKLGTALGRQGKLDDAAACFERVLARDPDNAATQHNLGFCFERQSKFEAALACYERVVALQPYTAEALNSVGRVLFALKQVDAAVAALERAVTLMPGHAGAWNNLGSALLEAHRPAESLASYDRALKLSPADATAWFNRGNALVRLKRLDEALASFARCEALTPDFAPVHLGESLCRLRAGDLPRGWEKYEWRARIRPDLMRVFEVPPWLGVEDPSGQTILLHSEQGFGDVIQFCRYVPQVAARGARVVLEVPPVLKRLLATLDGVAALHAQGEAAPDARADTHCPLLSLPLAFKTALGTIPAQVPYLAVPPDVGARWRERLRDLPRPRIGLAWSGRAGHLGEQHRSIAPDQLTPLLSCGATIVSLQKEYRAEDRDWLAAHPEVLDFSDALEDFADTAALASLMDVVVTIDTAVAHLAGALALPVWVLLSYIGDWRWMEDRGDSPWYPTATLYRQTRINDWRGVIARVAEDLCEGRWTSR